MAQGPDESFSGGRYRLIRQVGSGGMGTVRQARDEMLDRVVAIRLPASPVGIPSAEREQQIERVRREARLAGWLD